MHDQLIVQALAANDNQQGLTGKGQRVDILLAAVCAGNGRAVAVIAAEFDLAVAAARDGSQPQEHHERYRNSHQCSGYWQAERQGRVQVNHMPYQRLI